MKAISKADLIDAIRSINREGMDNSRWGIDVFSSEKNTGELYGTHRDVMLAPGAYLIVWYDGVVDIKECYFGMWLDKMLKDDNFELLFTDNGCVIIVALDIL